MHCCDNVMNDADKSVYNTMGCSSSPKGKPSYTELGLQRGWQKRGIMWKTGPNPSWYSQWNKRMFTLKGNFLYYCNVSSEKELKAVPVLGAIYLTNAVIEKDSLPFAKRVLRIAPSVPRRRSWEEQDDSSSVFFVKFKDDDQLDEWFEALQQVAFGFRFPSERPPLITSSMEAIS